MAVAGPNAADPQKLVLAPQAQPLDQAIGKEIEKQPALSRWLALFWQSIQDGFVKISRSVQVLEQREKDDYFWSQNGNVAVTTNVQPKQIAAASGRLIGAHAHVDTAPTGAAIKLDILDGTQLLWPTGSLQIAAGSTDGDFRGPFTQNYVQENDILQLNITQIGSGTAGANLVVTLKIA
jgi:hypothetical protein